MVMLMQAKAQEKSVETQIKTFFAGMAAHDTLMIKSVIHESCILKSVSKNKSGNTIMSTDPIAKFYKSIGGLPKDLEIDERISQVITNEDALLAYAWTPYELFVNKKSSHKGTNLFTFAKFDGIWKVVAIIDTRFKD